MVSDITINVLHIKMKKWRRLRLKGFGFETIVSIAQLQKYLSQSHGQYVLIPVLASDAQLNKHQDNKTAEQGGQKKKVARQPSKPINNEESDFDDYNTETQFYTRGSRGGTNYWTSLQ